MKTILAFFIKIYNWLMCFLTKDCPYSLKKLLAILSFIVAIYLAIFAPVEKFDTLVAMLAFIASLLGLQSIDKYNYNKNNNTQNLG
jgi:hypothetical protein